MTFKSTVCFRKMCTTGGELCTNCAKAAGRRCSNCHKGKKIKYKSVPLDLFLNGNFFQRGEEGAGIILFSKKTCVFFHTKHF